MTSIPGPRRRFLCALGVGLLPFGPAVAEALTGRWRLEVLDPQQRVRVSLTIRFTGQRADSCLGLGEGDQVLPWQRVAVEASDRADEAFFPSKDPLAATLNGEVLTLGRVAACDAYRLLRGRVEKGVATGRYVSLGKGGERVLGAFRLTALT